MLTQLTRPRQRLQSAPTQEQQRRARRSAPGSGDSASADLQASRSYAARTGPSCWPGSAHATQGWRCLWWLGLVVWVVSSQNGETRQHSAVPKHCKILRYSYELVRADGLVDSFPQQHFRVCSRLRTCVTSTLEVHTSFLDNLSSLDTPYSK